jgi:hypothetical protein
VRDDACSSLFDPCKQYQWWLLLIVKSRFLLGVR